MDKVKVPAGLVGRVTEFDEVDGHLMAKVRFAGGAFEWFLSDKLTPV